MAPNHRRRSTLEMQKRTRKEHGFDKTESDLSSTDFSTAISAKLSASDKFYDAFSYLGKKNPFSRTVTSQDTVWLLDNTAYRNRTSGKWEAEYVAAIFSQHSSGVISDAMSMIAKQIGLDERDPNWPTLEERTKLFTQTIKPATTVKALYRNTVPLKLGPGGRQGISSDIKKLPGIENGELLAPTFADVPKGVNGVLEMRTFYAEPEGWAVISDVDDTIKITQTSDPIGILRTTFVDAPSVCPGMPELYWHIQSVIKDTSPWFYLSASPYNLYPFLRAFREAYYPHGTIILRDSSWMSIPGLLSSLTLGTEEYKVDRMEKIHSWLPRRKMILIGDSTQSDPESYGEIYRTYPDWVKVILIRKVEDIAAIGIDSKNQPERFEEAFEGIPKDVWHVFTDPAECAKIIDNTVASAS
ncbi:hypothetical protein DL764_006554 [Monosporascus ibericus]|uniref:Phosphatidate phosphatase APP1 catalytic domain-containing protein n=1 Tax=Monosporascus ibericus TaxID=155417 RepID=A0A4Q4T6F0_9PEZI|nr:hypothetical protein DL764_006554 [Monosporascus ibericus]